VELKLKTPWRDGTTHLVMSPLEFMQRLAALIPCSQAGAAASANSSFAAVNLDRRVPAMGRVPVLATGVRAAAVHRTPDLQTWLTGMCSQAVRRRGPASGSCRP